MMMRVVVMKIMMMMIMMKHIKFVSFWSPGPNYLNTTIHDVLKSPGKRPNDRLSKYIS